MKTVLRKFKKKLCGIMHRMAGHWWLNPKNFGYLDPTCMIEEPIAIDNPSGVYLHQYTKLRKSAKILTSPGYKFIVKKYTACAFGLTVVTGNHRPILGLPHFFSGGNHIRDKEKDIIIEEAVWCGTNVTLLYGTHIGRGAIIGSGAIVNREIPPYAVAVGIPAKVVASVFTIDEILRHEALIYPENERFSREYLEELFAVHYEGKKSIGLDVDLTEDELCRLRRFDKIFNCGIITDDYNEKIKSGRSDRLSITPNKPFD